MEELEKTGETLNSTEEKAVLNQEKNGIGLEEGKEKKKNLGRDEVTGRFLPGNKYGRGRPKGIPDFRTDFERALKQLTKERGIPVSQARQILIKKAFEEILDKGSFSYFKDILDRYYGKPVEKIEYQGNLELRELTEEIKKIIE
jgi:hypothetical protein